MKVIIAGSRHITDKVTAFKAIEQYIGQLELETGRKVTHIICGGAKGGDKIGEEWARQRRLMVEMFIPDWEANPRGAGFIRNAEMGMAADALIALWDGQSNGTGHMVEFMKKAKKPTFIQLFDPPASVEQKPIKQTNTMNLLDLI